MEWSIYLSAIFYFQKSRFWPYGCNLNMLNFINNLIFFSTNHLHSQNWRSWIQESVIKSRDLEKKSNQRKDKLEKPQTTERSLSKGSHNCLQIKHLWTIYSNKLKHKRNTVVLVKISEKPNKHSPKTIINTNLKLKHNTERLLKNKSCK